MYLNRLGSDRAGHSKAGQKRVSEKQMTGHKAWPSDCHIVQGILRCCSAVGKLQHNHDLPLNMPSVSCRDSTPIDSFVERLRQQDEAFRTALDNKAFETGIREVQGHDAADDALRKLLDARDQAQASH